MDIARRSSNPNEIVDPTSDEIAEARRATFGSWWPHDGKKGWKCKMEKVNKRNKLSYNVSAKLTYYGPIDGRGWMVFLSGRGE